MATYVTASNDGGQTFSPDAYANDPETAIDAITGQTEVLGPIPDSQAITPGTLGFGTTKAWPFWTASLSGLVE